MFEAALGVVAGDAAQRPDLVERTIIEQPFQALAHGQAAGVVLAFDLFRATHLVGKGFAPAQLLDLGFPGHDLLRLACPAPARR